MPLPRLPFVLALALAAGGGAVAWLGTEDGGGPEGPAAADAPPPAATPAPPPAAEPAPASLVLEGGASAPPDQKARRQLALLLERLARVRELIAAGRWKEALALLDQIAKERAEYPLVPDFDERLRVLRMDAASRQGVKALAALKPGPEAQGLSRAELTRRIEATREVLARAGSVEDLAAYERHLRRFLLADVDAQSAAPADRAFGAFLTDRRGRRAKVPRPPVADPAETERRRVEELERLRQRGAVGLLDAIHGALAWLALHQVEDGSFHETGCNGRCGELKHDPVCLSSPGADQGKRWSVGTSGLAALAWLDFRDQDIHGLFDPYLGRTLEWLAKQQRPDGSFPGTLYEGSIAIMALGQAAVSTGLTAHRDACARGILWLERAQARGGGFRYGPNAADADLSVTAWAAQAVEAARAAGIPIPDRLQYGFEEFLAWCHLGEHRYSYTDGVTESRSLAPAGMLLARLTTPAVDPALAASWTAYLGGLPPRQTPSLYTLYYGVRLSILLNNSLAEPWRTWVFVLADGKRRPQSPGLLVPAGYGSHGNPLVDHALATLTIEHALYLR